jgi:hypothetical protein
MEVVGEQNFGKDFGVQVGFKFGLAAPDRTSGTHRSNYLDAVALAFNIFSKSGLWGWPPARAF